MGQEYEATCLDCGHRFKAMEDGGFAFQLVHCDTCGRDKTVPFLKPRDSVPKGADQAATEARSVPPWDTHLLRRHFRR